MNYYNLQILMDTCKKSIELIRLMKLHITDIILLEKINILLIKMTDRYNMIEDNIRDHFNVNSTQSIESIFKDAEKLKHDMSRLIKSIQGIISAQKNQINEVLRSDIEKVYDELDPTKKEYILLQTVDNDEYKIYPGTKWSDEADHILIGPKEDKTKVYYNTIIKMDKLGDQPERDTETPAASEPTDLDLTLPTETEPTAEPEKIPDLNEPTAPIETPETPESEPISTDTEPEDVADQDAERDIKAQLKEYVVKFIRENIKK